MTTSTGALLLSCGAVLGPLAMTVALSAQQTVPLTFREGDVISANVMNGILQQLENATNSITSDDFVGTWTITQVVPYHGQPGNGSCRFPSPGFPAGSCAITGTTDAADGLTRYRTDVLTVAAGGNTHSYSQANVSSFTSAHTNSPDAGHVSVIAETAVFRNSSTGVFEYYYARKKSARRIVLQDIKSGSNSFNMVILDKRNTAPHPPNNVVATVLGHSVALSWTDQSSDETGFRVHRKTSATGNWTEVTTTGANATSFTHAGVTAGTYWYRVLTTNADGDSISSSEVLATIQ